MKMLIPQREHFAGAELLSPAWTLHKAGKSAVCTVWSHQFGFELRLAIDGDDLRVVGSFKSDVHKIHETLEYRLEGVVT